MHQYRTHNCGQLTIKNVGQHVKLSGWVHRKRDHGGVYFIDLRDNYGYTQIVTSELDDNIVKLSADKYKEITTLSFETVICIEGKVVARMAEAINKDIPTGEIEVVIEKFDVISKAELLPLNVNSDYQFPEDLRLKFTNGLANSLVFIHLIFNKPSRKPINQNAFPLQIKSFLHCQSFPLNSLE